MFRRVGTNISPQNDEEKLWQKKVLGTALLEDYDENDFISDAELELLTKIFGIYERNTPKFNGRYFVPASHSNYEE